MEQNEDRERGSSVRPREWLALLAVGLGTLMVVIDGTAIALAMPLIKSEFGLSQQDLVWVVNAYLITNAGFLLLSGRLGDLFGHRRVFFYGLTLFGFTSIWCGLSRSWLEIICARVLQGVSAAILTTVALPLIMKVVPHSESRPKALGIYGFIINSGSAVGLLLSGTLTSLSGWRSIFLANVPLTGLVYLLCSALLPRDPTSVAGKPLDMAGAFTITAALTASALAIIQCSDIGLESPQTLMVILSALILSAAFLTIEASSSAPLIPLHVFRKRSLIVLSVVSALFSAALSAGLFASLYVQMVLGYSGLQTSVAFVPSVLVTAASSLGLSARLVTRFGVKRPLIASLLTAAAGLMLLTRVPVRGSFAMNVFPGLLLFHLGAGACGSPLVVGATSGVQSGETGLASGVLGTTSLMGATLGLTVLAGAAAPSPRHLTSGVDSLVALTNGYHQAFAVGATAALLAALLVMVFPISDSISGPMPFEG